MITIATNASDRKELVRKLAAHMGVAARYLGVPSCAFEVGDITVTRDATVAGSPETMREIIPFLVEQGYIEPPVVQVLTEQGYLPAAAGEPEAKPEAEQEQESAEEAETEQTEEPAVEPEQEQTPATEPATESTEPAPAEEAEPEQPEVPATNRYDLEALLADLEDGRASVHIPLTDCTPQGLANILRMLYARQDLISAMTGCDFIRVDEELVTLLEDTKPDSMAKISELLATETAAGMVRGIRLESDIAVQETDDAPLEEYYILVLDTVFDEARPTRWKSFSVLANALIGKAKTAHHVSTKRISPADEEMKYFCNTWVVQMGLGGAEHKVTRGQLLSHLQGYAAFRTGEKMAAHKQKYAELRRARREAEGTDREEN